MSNEEKERRCKSCGKLLLDEKLSLCRRCFLERRNKVGQIGGTAAGVAAAFFGAITFIKNNSDGGNDSLESDESEEEE